MKAQDILLLLLLIGVIVLVVARADVVRQALDQVVAPRPTASPGICANFQFQGLLPRGTSVRQVMPLDTDDDGLQECVVLYEVVADSGGQVQHAVSGLVYDFQVNGEAGDDPSRLPVGNMHRYELRTDYGRLVLLGVAEGGDSSFQVAAMDADTHDGSELVVLSHDGEGHLVGLAAFRWRGSQSGYQLVGYVYGDWLQTRPSPVDRYVDEVVVCDRQYPADADMPNQATGQVFVWQDGKLTLDPDHGRVVCSQ